MWKSSHKDGFHLSGPRSSGFYLRAPSHGLAMTFVKKTPVQSRRGSNVVFKHPKVKVFYVSLGIALIDSHYMRIQSSAQENRWAWENRQSQGLVWICVPWPRARTLRTLVPFPPFCCLHMASPTCCLLCLSSVPSELHMLASVNIYKTVSGLQIPSTSSPLLLPPQKKWKSKQTKD